MTLTNPASFDWQIETLRFIYTRKPWSSNYKVLGVELREVGTGNNRASVLSGKFVIN